MSKHPNANIVIWSDSRLITELSFPITLSGNFYDSLEKKCLQFQLFAESEKDFAARFKTFTTEYTNLLRTPINSCKCLPHVKLVNFPAVYLASVLHAQSNARNSNTIEFEKILLTKFDD